MKPAGSPGSGEELPVSGSTSGKLIRLDALTQNAPLGHLLKAFSDPLERLLSLDRINAIYTATQLGCSRGNNFFEACVQAMDLSCEIPEGDLDRIPRKGPVVVVANHPFGGAEGILLGKLMLQIRPDVKLMANYLLGSMPEMRPWLIPVDPFGQNASARKNIRPMKDALQWLKHGGLLVVFPAGEVSHLRLSNRGVTDPPWNAHAASLIRRSCASVVPIYIHGQNSWFFQFSGLVHPRLRTALLPRELAGCLRHPMRLLVGQSVPALKCGRFADDAALTRYLRSATYLLRNRLQRGGAGRSNKGKRKMAVIAPVPSRLLEAEIAGLPEGARLAAQGEFGVYLAEACRIPNLLREIGRLREITFREVGEGSGKELDLDEYDPHYRHLLLWNGGKNELVGAYRLGVASELLARRGARGLYTSTLFRFKKPFLKKLESAAELGRSFIRSDYQRSYVALSLLWRGIGEFIVRNPACHLLFGPVSISHDYHPVSRHLMLQFLRDKLQDRESSRHVRASNPPRPARVSGLCKRDVSMLMDNVEDVSALVSSLEPDSKGIPVLLRHYISMKAVLISFNVDRNFSDALDGLMMADLRQCDEKLLKRFMGEAGCERFRVFHGLQS
ncbi:MAG: lysophospholipid acyltransferase family protein [Methylacidiphilales bacterium]|nr:lysophospholipid acyltransferase family protein [Candidatus Methylacidiphilales bacterium]